MQEKSLVREIKVALFNDGTVEYRDRHTNDLLPASVANIVKSESGLKYPFEWLATELNNNGSIFLSRIESIGLVMREPQMLIDLLRSLGHLPPAAPEVISVKLDVESATSKAAIDYLRKNVADNAHLLHAGDQVKYAQPKPTAEDAQDEVVIEPERTPAQDASDELYSPLSPEELATAEIAHSPDPLEMFSIPRTADELMTGDQIRAKGRLLTVVQVRMRSSKPILVEDTDNPDRPTFAMRDCDWKFVARPD